MKDQDYKLTSVSISILRDYTIKYKYPVIKIKEITIIIIKICIIIPISSTIIIHLNIKEDLSNNDAKTESKVGENENLIEYAYIKENRRKRYSSKNKIIFILV